MSRHIVFMNWRDTANPEGGGSEVFVEHIARGLVERGHRVTIVCAAHDQAPADETRDGVRFVRRGNHVTVYARGWWLAFRGRLGHVDAYVDVQNGIPFFARLAGRTPTVILVHHVHREQWPVLFPGLVGKVGWMIESQIARRLFKGCQYVAVSRSTRAELIRLGVRADDVAVVHNGAEPAPHVSTRRAEDPVVCTLGRLVPHKQVEHAIDAVAHLQAQVPRIHLRVVGSGWWEDALRTYVGQRQLGHLVTFEGHVDDRRKHEILAQSWVLALPSLKEGWGLVIGEAAQHDVPTLAYRSAGGTTESVVDSVTGLLAADRSDFEFQLGQLIKDDSYRERLGRAAREQALSYTWTHATVSFETILDAAISGRKHVDAVDPD